MPTATPESAQTLASDLRQAIDEIVADFGDRTFPLPGHRMKFHWPPHPISREFHVVASDWSGRSSIEAYGETFDVIVAETPHGFFGRVEELWHEARGQSLEEMLSHLREEVEPLFKRQFSIANALRQTGRFKGHVRDLQPLELLLLLFCDDRDVAQEAMTEIETHASSRIFLPSLLEVLNERRHPMRRSAQWCVLDLLEDLPSFAHTIEEEAQAVGAMAALLWDADDDACRTVYKAGVVLGGHVSGKLGGPALLRALDAPSRIGRRSAIHGLYHVVEWSPELLDPIVWALSGVASRDPESILREYAANMARDISAQADHVPDPVFADERGS